jgi:hypothetical protein
MALVSPGVQVTVIDESQYIPSAVNTVPYFVIATAQNKVSGSGVGVAAGTLQANANKTYLITSQRDLTATFGVPFFYNTTTGTPINGYELNEYGLLAAYSSLGASSLAYVQRVDINLTDLTASLTRPTGNAPDGTFWLDTSTSVWGIQEWNAETQSFSVITPAVITDEADVEDASVGDFTPVQSYGTIGSYAVVSIAAGSQGDTHNVCWYKNNANEWVILGSSDWQIVHSTVEGTAAPTFLTEGDDFDINGETITVPALPDNSVTGVAYEINNNVTLSGQGVTAEVVSGRLAIYFSGNPATPVVIAAGTGTVLVDLGLDAGSYYPPVYNIGYSYQAPRWASTQPQPRPTGSVWNNTSPVNNGLNLKLKKYSAILDTWVAQNTPAYSGTVTALYGLDPTGGGQNIAAGTTFVQWTANLWATTPQTSFSFEILEKIALGKTIVTGTTTNPTFTSGNTFTLQATEAGSTTLNSALVTVVGTNATAFVTSVLAAGVPNVSCTVSTAGNIVFTHEQGGAIFLLDQGGGTAVVDAGFDSDTPLCRYSPLDNETLILSTFVTNPEFVYIPSDTAPDQDPPEGRLWYYSAVDEVDIMIQNNGAWVGYQNCTNDVRGYNLSNTNATGPIIAATAPTLQSDGVTQLALGDLWIDSSDLENYPKLYRWTLVSGAKQWVAVDTTDQVTQNGILFADARWAPNGTTDPVADPFPSIVDMLTSNYLDLDAPDPDLYPQGMLLWNTRRSGYNVKSFQVDYFNTDSTVFAVDQYSNTTTYNYNDFVVYDGIIYVCIATTTGNAPGNLTYWNQINTNTWLTASGNKANGSMYAGRLAQREMILKAMKSGLDTSIGAREDSAQFTLIATPGYPEMIPNMIALSNERNNTLFVVGDTPMRLASNGNDLISWATNNNGLGLSTEDGQVATSNYCATFYPSCTTTDLGGNTVVQPPSHMMMRTIIRSDEVSYPWLAPAGTRRGVVDNAIQIGYIDATTGEFQPLTVNQALRDILYTNNVNPITFIPGIGITNFGNKTSRAVTTALDRINVARLVAFLRGRLNEIGKLYLFEPNDQITRNEITNTCNSLMIDLIAKRAIYDYLVVCDLTNNTPARIDRNELWVDIAIEPVKAVEFIYIPLRIKNTGEIAAGA